MDEEFQDFLNDIKLTINSEEGEKIHLKLNEIMKTNDCSMIDACIQLADELLNEK